WAGPPRAHPGGSRSRTRRPGGLWGRWCSSVGFLSVAPSRSLGSHPGTRRRCCCLRPSGGGGLAAVPRPRGLGPHRVGLGGGLATGADLEAGDERLGLRSEEHTSELQSRENLVCRLL